MATLPSALRQSVRMLRQSPGFTSVAILALALGIGANTAIFTVVDRVLLRPLPYPDSERLMSLQRRYPNVTGSTISIPKFMAWKKAQTFQSVTAHDFGAISLSLGAGDRPDPINAIHVSAGFFDVFAVKPLLGRTFTPQEDLPKTGRYAILTHRVWTNRFGANPNLPGTPVLLNSEPHTVVGILPEGFASDPPADIYLPLQADPNSSNQGHYLTVIARLRPNATRLSAEAELKIIAEQFRKLYPNTMDKQESVAVIPLRDAIAGDVRTALLVLLGAVSFVLLMACANVANLLLARAAGRQREVAIRTALGASRGQIVRQLLSESLVLASAGGLLGFLLGIVGVKALLAVSPGNIPRITGSDQTISFLSLLDWRVFLFVCVLSLLTGILFSLFPSIQVSRLDVNSHLKESSGRSGTSLKHNRVRSFLVISEIALAVILLVGAALLIRTFMGLRAVNPGFDSANVLTLKTSLASGRYSTTAQVENMIRLITERLHAIPGVQAAATAIALPVEGGVDLPFVIEGRTPPNGAKWQGDEQWRSVSARYFQTFRIPHLRGRLFDERDTGKSSPSVIVNEAFAKKHWPKSDPIGQRINIGKGLGPEFEEGPREVVGIVGSVHEVGLSRGAQPVMYIPAGQVTEGLTKLANSVLPLSWAIRTQNDPLSLSASIQREILAFDTQLAPTKVRAMTEVMSESTARENFNMLLLTVFAGLALFLAAIGVYGLMSYSVEQRTQELGIRMALGAAREHNLRMILRHGLQLTAIGVALGLAAAYGLTRLLASLLFGVNARDPLTFLSVAAILGAVALLAAFVPAWRASRVDPLTALRHE